MNAFFFGIWGKQHTSRFIIFTIPCLLDNFSYLKKSITKKIKIEIWIPHQDYNLLKSNSNFKKLKKIVNVRINLIDNFLKTLRENNKYYLLSIMHNIFISTHSIKYKYLWFIYPDFYFSDELIKKIIKIMDNKNYDSVVMPVPQINDENVRQIFLKKNISKIDKKKIIINNLHQNNFICDLENLKTGSPPFLYLRNKKKFLLRCFHAHPIVINSWKNLDIFSEILYPTIDEGYYEKLAKRKIFLPSSDKFGICVSVHDLDYVSINKTKFNIRDFVFFYIRHITSAHLTFSKTIYEFGDHKVKISSKKISKLKNFQNKLLSKIYNLKINNNFSIKDTSKLINLFHNKFKLSLLDFGKILKEEEDYRNFIKRNSILEANNIIFKNLIYTKNKKKILKEIVLNLHNDKKYKKIDLNFLNEVYKKNI